MELSQHNSTSVNAPRWLSLSYSTNDLPMENVPGAPPLEHTLNKEKIQPRKPDRTYSPDPTTAKPPRQVFGVEYVEGKYMAKQPECTTTITSTQNNGIHRIQFGQHTIFNWLNHLASKQKCGQINIWGSDCSTSKMTHSYQQKPCESSSLKSISSSAIIFGLNIIHISSGHYTTGIFSNV